MRFIRGTTLRERLKKEGRVEARQATGLCVELLDALQAAHSCGIIHRDVKPENIMLSDDAAFLIDFSIGFSSTSATARVTGTGENFGTVDYMCPEQAKDMGRVDARCDLHSLGVVLFEMMAGTPKIRENEFDRDLAHVSTELRDLVRRATAASEDQRFQTAAEFMTALNVFKGPAGPTVMPAVTAVCANLTCAGAKWSPNGYYQGPSVIPDCNETFCGHCGNKLARHCPRCSGPFLGTPYCGTCGAEWFQVPECATCGSFLKKSDMGADTSVECCSRGRRKGFKKTDGWDIPF